MCGVGAPIRVVGPSRALRNPVRAVLLGVYCHIGSLNGEPFPTSGFLFSVRDQAMPSIDFPAVRAAISLQSVLELLGFVPSERRGDQLRGPCPIHKSKSPQSRSFSAKLARNAFQCFTCKAAGNQIDLWSLTQSLTLFDAATDLCNRLQIAVPQRSSQTHRSAKRPCQRRGTRKPEAATRVELLLKVCKPKRGSRTRQRFETPAREEEPVSPKLSHTSNYLLVP